MGYSSERTLQRNISSEPSFLNSVSWFHTNLATYEVRIIYLLSKQMF